MSDHDSGSESESIEQWESAEVSNRNKILKAAATEARTKASVMGIRLLKDRKAVSILLFSAPNKLWYLVGLWDMVPKPRNEEEAG